MLGSNGLQPSSIFKAFLLSLSPAIIEEVAYRTVFYAFCLTMISARSWIRKVRNWQLMPWWLFCIYYRIRWSVLTMVFYLDCWNGWFQWFYTSLFLDWFLLFCRENEILYQLWLLTVPLILFAFVYLGCLFDLNGVR